MAQNEFQVLLPAEAARFVVTAESNVLALDLPEPLRTEVFGDIRAAIAARAEVGFSVSPTNKEEVGGLVRAVMGGLDHVKKARVELNRFVVGLLQTDEALLQAARNSSQRDRN